VIRSFHHAEFPLEWLLERKTAPVSVVLPAREVADTVGSIVERIVGLDGLVDQVLVVDADSEDGSAAVAAAAGAEVRQQCELVPELGPVIGKGDAMWRALAAVRGETVLYIDADTRDFCPHFITGLLGPLLADEGLEFVKASYRRPFTVGEVELPDDGGRVSQLTARPLLAAFYPDIAELAQPLAGEVAASRKLFASVPFSVGYAVETAMLLDVREQIGAAAIAQVDVGERRNYHQPLGSLRPMAETVMAVVCERLRRDGRLVGATGSVEILERPPFAVHAPA
jgi:glucosyl-3-phosphoglycerate synthase